MKTIRTRGLQGMERLAAGLLLLATFAVLPLRMAAQETEDDFSPTFAGGHMIRGTVTAVAGEQMTVKTEAGEVFRVVVSANTRLNKDRLPVKLSDIKRGDGVGAMGVLDAPTRTIHAIFIGVMDADQVKKAREDLGKVFIIGKITAIDLDGLKLTVLRPDGVSQVIGVDESTSFKRGGRQMSTVLSGNGDIGSPATDRPGRDAAESITLSDLKTGDSIAGRGGLKNGLFVPTDLRVMDAAAKAQRRRRAAGGEAQDALPSPPPQ